MNEQKLARSLILTIDDDAMMRLMLHDILGREGFDVLKAANGKDGIEIIKTQRPKLVLLDVIMPESDGFDCLQAIRAIPGMELLPIVMLTGADDVDSINRSFKLGATDFIAKPINWATLSHRLRYLLRASSALSRLAKSEAELRVAQKIACLGSWDWRVVDDRMQWSEEIFNVLDIEPDNFQGRRLDLSKVLERTDAAKLYQTIEHCIKSKQGFQLQFHLSRADGSDRVVLIRGEPIVADNIVVRIQGTVQDISERQRIQEQVYFLSHYDPLTGLPNRTLFKEILSRSLAYCDRNQSKLSALFISIDRFKRINETLGPAAGDRMLKMFADRLANGFRGSDYLVVNAGHKETEGMVSRLGGNEFTVLLDPIEDASDSVKIAKRILHLMASPFHFGEQELFLSINIGIVVYPGDGSEEDSFIKNGEFAMSHAKALGQNSYQFFSKSLNVAAFHKLSLENNLRRSIERGELLLYYQPKINMRQKRVIGCEALIRWLHPELGLLPPAQFIPIAEECGLIVPISNWVMDTACAQLRQWQLQGMPALSMAVNVSASQFQQSGFISEVDRLFTRHALAPALLTLELTESILLQDADDALATLNELSALGVKVSIDDFGTGYSSLAYLKKLPISELKIDRSFIRDIPHNEDDLAITTAIYSLATSLSLEVVAEGVENQAQADYLKQLGCEIAQGFLFSKPIPAAEFTVFVRRLMQKNMKAANAARDEL